MDPFIKKEVTAKFKDVQLLMDELKIIKRNERRVKRRLKTKYLQYNFLSDLVGVSKNDKRLVEPVFKFFKSLNFAIEHAPNQDKNGVEDLRLFTNDKLFIIEVGGIRNPNPTEVKTTQIIKHLKIRQAEFPKYKVIGLTIINHDDTKPFYSRNNKAYIQRQIDIATSHECTLTTTITLLKAFIKIEQGELTNNDLIVGLSKYGLYDL